MNGRNNSVLSKRMREINISMDFRKSGWESVEWIKKREASGKLLALERETLLRGFTEEERKQKMSDKYKSNQLINKTKIKQEDI